MRREDDRAPTGNEPGPADEPLDRTVDGAAAGDEAPTFDWRGWALVGTLVVALLVVPGALLLLPSVRGFVASVGLSLRDAYLVLPLVPAFLLGGVAVWSALRTREN